MINLPSFFGGGDRGSHSIHRSYPRKAQKSLGFDHPRAQHLKLARQWYQMRLRDKTSRWKRNTGKKDETWMILWMEEILHHQKDGWNPINNGINHLPTGAGFLPSTVVKPEKIGKVEHLEIWGTYHLHIIYNISHWNRHFFGFPVAICKSPIWRTSIVSFEEKKWSDPSCWRLASLIPSYTRSVQNPLVFYYLG